mmetsp:Transcript_59262/g.156083  ORF Transcript_59262/g.156083 Transcript_59262/m.156083 type:complete len:241 (-) Transcript_59262:287-1009(-)
MGLMRAPWCGLKVCCGVCGGVPSASGRAASIRAPKFCSSAGGQAETGSCQKRINKSRHRHCFESWLSGRGLAMANSLAPPANMPPDPPSPLAAAEGLLGHRLITSMFSAVKVERSVHHRPPCRFAMTLAAVPPPDFAAAERRMFAMSARSRNARRALISFFQVGGSSSLHSDPDPEPSLSVVLTLFSLASPMFLASLPRLSLPPTTSPVLGFLMVKALLGPVAFPSLLWKASPLDMPCSA